MLLNGKLLGLPMDVAGVRVSERSLTSFYFVRTDYTMKAVWFMVIFQNSTFL
jgi:hypothetical protein